jgi:hypothetical protein
MLDIDKYKKEDIELQKRVACTYCHETFWGPCTMYHYFGEYKNQYYCSEKCMLLDRLEGSK